MRVRLEQADGFREDFALQVLWYVRDAGEDVARRFQPAVEGTLLKLCAQPDLGRVRGFRHPKLQGLRSLPVMRPFQSFLVFYRVVGESLQAVRLMHGARDLPRRLAEPPGHE